MNGSGAMLLMMGLLVAGLVSLRWLLPFFEKRGWIQVSGLGARGKRALGSALLGVDQVLAPQVRHVAKAREEGVRAPKKREGEPGGGADDHTDE